MLDPDSKIARRYGFFKTPAMILATGDGVMISKIDNYKKSGADKVTSIIEENIK